MRNQAQTNQLLKDRQRVLALIGKLIIDAGLKVVDLDWDDYNFDFGSAKFETREDAFMFCEILPTGYEASVLGTSTSVTIDLV